MLFPKYRAYGGINAAIQRGFVNTKNKQARRCVLEGHVQSLRFQGRCAHFAILRVLSKVLKLIFAAISRDLRALHEWFPLALRRCGLSWRVPPPGWHEEEAGMCFQTRIFDPSFWRGKAGQVELQMDPADPISFWWQRSGKVRAVRQLGVKLPPSSGPRKWWF